MGKNDSALSLATDEIAKRLGIKREDVEIFSERSEKGEKTKETYLRVAGRNKNDRNGPSVTLVLNSKNAFVSKAEAERAEGRRLFELGPVGPIELPPGWPRPELSPPTVSLGECDQPTIKLDVTAPPMSCPVDVYFLIDTTGSMSEELSAAQAGVLALMNSLASTGMNIWFGAGQYRDFVFDPFAFQNAQSLTDDTLVVSNAINGLTIGNGNQWPEAQFYAMDQIAKNAVGWRPGSCRYLVWVGDAPGNDPICPSVSGLSYPITEASVIADLQAMGITVLACDVGSLDSAPTGNEYASMGCKTTGTAGQASRITAQTGGSLSSGVTASTLVAAITNSLNTAFQIGNISLTTTGAITPFVTGIKPPGGIGPVNPGDTVTFSVSFDRGARTCAKRDQVFDGAFVVLIDGVAVSKIPYRVAIPRCRYRYAVKFVCGLLDSGTPHGNQCMPVLPGRYSTEINILNTHCSLATIEKSVIPVYLDGKAIGREPAQVKPMAHDRIKLEPGNATMDDCCRIAQLLKKPVGVGPLMIGFLEITSDVPLTVTAVYTASGVNQGSLSIDVETIQPVVR